MADDRRGAKAGSDPELSHNIGHVRQCHEDERPPAKWNRFDLAGGAIQTGGERQSGQGMAYDRHGSGIVPGKLIMDVWG